MNGTEDGEVKCRFIMKCFQLFTRNLGRCRRSDWLRAGRLKLNSLYGQKLCSSRVLEWLWGPLTFITEVKRSECEADHLPLRRDEVCRM
jgi:hypothetical protein